MVDSTKERETPMSHYQVRCLYWPSNGNGACWYTLGYFTTKREALAAGNREEKRNGENAGGFDISRI